MSAQKTNLAKAQAVRSSGYKTKVHALPEFKKWFDAAYKGGDKTIQDLRREALSLFPELNNQIPSTASLKSYVDKYLSEIVKVAPYTPQYHEHIRNFDAYLKLIEAAKEFWRRYEQAKQREQVISSRKPASLDWAKLYKETLNDLLDIEIRLGIRQGMVVPANFQQVNIQNNMTNASTPSDDEIAKVLNDRLKIDAWKARATEYARERKLQVFGQETTPTSL